MKILHLALSLTVTAMFAAASVQAMPSDCKGKLDQIRELLKPVDSDPPETKQLKASLLHLPDQWQLLVDQGQTSRIPQDGIMMSLRGTGTQIPGLAERINEFGKCVAEENLRIETAKLADAKALIARVAVTLEKATKAEDLDDLMLALIENQLADYGNNPSIRPVASDLQNALEIVKDWQDYLIADETGNNSSRRSHLEQISSRLSRSPILPRSVVLRLLNKPVPPVPTSVATTPQPKTGIYDEIRNKLTESGDSATALSEINACPDIPSNSSEDFVFAKNVKIIEELRLLEPSMSESEVFANIRNFQNNNSRDKQTFVRAINQISLNAIAENHGFETPSAKTTSPQKVLESIASKAATDRDWEKLRKAINSLDSLASGNTTYGRMNKRGEDLKIISRIKLGETAEEQNDVEAAYSAYLEASMLDGEYLQKDVAYSKIANLRAKHPDKVADMMAKAAEIRQKAEVARHLAELEMQQRMMERPPMDDRLRNENLDVLRPLVQDVVAEFLKGKQKETPNLPEKTKDGKPGKAHD